MKAPLVFSAPFERKQFLQFPPSHLDAGVHKLLDAHALSCPDVVEGRRVREVLGDLPGKAANRSIVRMQQTLPFQRNVLRGSMTRVEREVKEEEGAGERGGCG